MSADPHLRSVAPAWLERPADANGLAPAVWPISASRDDAGVLTLGGIPATALRSRFGTPLYVVDEDEVRATARRTLDAFRAAAALHGVQARVYYAGKALLTTEVVRWVTEEGLAVDVCTGGGGIREREAELLVFMGRREEVVRLGVHAAVDPQQHRLRHPAALDNRREPLDLYQAVEDD